MRKKILTFLIPITLYLAAFIYMNGGGIIQEKLQGWSRVTAHVTEYREGNMSSINQNSARCFYLANYTHQEIEYKAWIGTRAHCDERQSIEIIINPNAPEDAKLGSVY